MPRIYVRGVFIRYRDSLHKNWRRLRGREPPNLSYVGLLDGDAEVLVGQLGEQQIEVLPSSHARDVGALDLQESKVNMCEEY